jgi:CubicO group peptidase (beta-lactamase class C family)
MNSTRREFLKDVGLGALALLPAQRLGAAETATVSPPASLVKSNIMNSNRAAHSAPENCLTLHVEPREVNVDPARLAEVPSFVCAELNRTNGSGAGLVAARHGKIFFEQYWGTYCNYEHCELLYDGSTLNMLYSFSKAITSTLVAMLHQEGLIDYDAPVSKFIPEFAGHGRELITVRHCLTHTAGIPSAGAPAAIGPDKWRVAVAELCKAVPEWPPGSKQVYHGTSGMFLLGEVARRVSGSADWNDLCWRRLFRPLGANSLSYRLPEPLDSLAVTPKPEKLPVPFDYSWLGHPGVGAFGRNIDALKIIQLHLNRGVWNGQVLLKPETLAEMHTRQFDAQIAKAEKEGRKPQFEFIGLGLGQRGTTTSSWGGFGSRVSDRAFGHAGIGTVMGIGDPVSGLALMFMTTDEPKKGKDVVAIRNGVTDRLAAALL